MRMKIACFAVASFLFIKVFPQTGLHDSSNASPALQSAISLYYHVTGENNHLNKGSEYPGYDVNLIGHPYFDTTAMTPGWISYEGTRYSNVPMLFDVYEDAVVINRYEKNYKIRLANEKIDSFSFLSHTFIRIVPDSNGSPSAGIGFYNRLYNGKYAVFVKRRKIIKDDPVIHGEMKSRYLAIEDYFIKKNGVYYPVRTAKSVTGLLKDKDKDLRRFIKKNKLNFKKRPEYAIVQVVKYYDEITN
jgi:hypothetical protein